MVSEVSRCWWVGLSATIAEESYRIVDCLYQQKRASIIILRVAGQCFGYLNLCVHMPFRLDCELGLEKNSVFDPQTGKITCSMHGITFDPQTGVALSPTMCTGARLTAIGVREDTRGIWVDDPAVEALWGDAE